MTVCSSLPYGTGQDHRRRGCWHRPTGPNTSPSTRCLSWAPRVRVHVCTGPRMQAGVCDQVSAVAPGWDNSSRSPLWPVTALLCGRKLISVLLQETAFYQVKPVSCVLKSSLFCLSVPKSVSVVPLVLWVCPFLPVFIAVSAGILVCLSVLRGIKPTAPTFCKDETLPLEHSQLLLSWAPSLASLHPICTGASVLICIGLLGIPQIFSLYFFILSFNFWKNKYK